MWQSSMPLTCSAYSERTIKSATNHKDRLIVCRHEAIGEDIPCRHGKLALSTSLQAPLRGLAGQHQAPSSSP